MSTAEQIGFIDEMIREAEAIKFRSYGVEQRLKALIAIRATLVAVMNAPAQKQEGKAG